jgi:alcohol dehydrogenase class IV
VAVTAEALKLAEETGTDNVVAIGGGSAIGLAKAISARTQ